ncbi:hypothetical protein H2204_002419 [Knufia peltigerae]|uniref:Uncharacterized protein n=1 Tax=Knufia peltigerae TaxID=1002370 RepID=A0AA38YBH3_9EURO|nr:hypothetical protein H2204_002419 [Knufia peltigerae]
MRLRRAITIPTRYEDEDLVAPRSRNGTRPAYPSLLKDQVISFNPDNPPARFPSLPLFASCPSARHQQHDIGAAAKPSTSLENVPMDSRNRHGNIRLLQSGKLIPTKADLAQPPNTHAPRDCSSTTHDFIATSPHTSAHAIQNKSQAPVATLVSKEQSSRSGADHSSALDASPVADGSGLCNTYRNEDAAMWNALPLSLQYQIFSTVARFHPTKHLKQLLGLTEEEFSEINSAASLRNDWSASLSEIWQCARNGTEHIPGFPDDISIDAENFKRLSDYMVFASSFEFAFKSEIRDAERYLLRRGMVCDLLTSWIPDPSEPDGTPYFVRLPAAAESITRIDSLLDPDLSSLRGAQRDEVISQKPPRHRPSIWDHTPVEENIHGKQKPSKGKSNVLGGRSTSEPLHLVLKIQSKDGLARVFKKKQKSSRRKLHPAEFETSLQALPHKRKASQDAGCPTPIKSPRKIDASSKSPATKLVANDINNEHIRHIDANLSRCRTLSLSHDCGHAVTPSSTGLLASDNSALRQASLASQSVRLRSPSYSPIPENEDLESYQALLRNPPRKMKISNACWSAEAHVQRKENQNKFSISPVQDIPHGRDASCATLMPIAPSMNTKHIPSSSSAAIESAVAATPKKPRIILLCKKPKDSSSSRIESSVCSTEQTLTKNQIESCNRESDMTITPHGAQDARVKDTEVGYSSVRRSQRLQAGPRPGQELASGNPSDETSEHVSTESRAKTSVKTSEKKLSLKKETREPDSQLRGPGRPRGPRGPYRKTRERMAKEKQEEAEEAESTSQGDTSLQPHDDLAPPMKSLKKEEKKKKRQGMM